ncbi:GxxExxY protein [Patescibacteria group bacterium]|nr:GxxExxY protein [Patescibacteria group bacterium]
MTRIKSTTELIYPDLSYKITGILFEVFKDLGAGYQEKYYQRAISISLKENGLKFKEQVSIPLEYKSHKIGRLILDFLIEDKIVLEIKKGNYFSPSNIKQINAYLKATDLKLGLLANFTSSGVKFKRILNIY